MTSDRNFSGQVPPAVLDDHYVRCNFSQPEPLDVAGIKRGVPIFGADLTPRTFEDCNLINCETPPGSTLVRCNTAILERGVVLSVDTITVDGGDPVTYEHTGTRVHGRWNGVTYDYLQDPRDEPDGVR